MARRTEGSINNDLAAALRRLHPAWNERTVLAESTGVLTEGAGRRPDIVVTNDRRTGGVILETEFEQARTVEDDARARLGSTFAADGSPVEQVVAVRIPAEARTPGTRLEMLTYSYKVCTNGTESLTWFPTHGWIEGTLADLAGFVETVTVSPRKLAEGVNALETGVGQAANIIRAGMAETRRAGLEAMAKVLHQRDGEQTTRMAAAIMANALVVHSAIAGIEEAIAPPSHPTLRGHGNILLPGAVLETWSAILDVNYWPIFKVAHDVLEAMDTATAGRALRRLDEAAQLNTTPGLIARWWVSTRQQRGRACLTVRTLGAIPVLDLRKSAASATVALAGTLTRFRGRADPPAHVAGVVGILAVPGPGLLRAKLKRCVAHVHTRTHSRCNPDPPPIGRRHDLISPQRMLRRVRAALDLHNNGMNSRIDVGRPAGARAGIFGFVDGIH